MKKLHEYSPEELNEFGYEDRHFLAEEAEWDRIKAERAERAERIARGETMSDAAGDAPTPLFEFKDGSMTDIGTRMCELNDKYGPPPGYPVDYGFQDMAAYLEWRDAPATVSLSQRWRQSFSEVRLRLIDVFRRVAATLPSTRRSRS